MRLSVCLFVHALKGKWPELSTPKSVDIYSMVGPRHAVTLRSKGHILTLISGYNQRLRENSLHLPGMGLKVWSGLQDVNLVRLVS